ncbi:MAG: hypothetical protein H0V04_03440 [Chloroflexi bacterium]|nr:hypothetical protein [Chloroflexota bacterium]
MARLAARAAMAALGITALGIAILVATAYNEAQAHPGFSLENGYWIGRLPWTDIGVRLTVIGSTAAVGFGAISVWLGGRGLRSLVVLLALAIALFWWTYALMQVPEGGAWCPMCPPRQPDPFARAYSEPGLTLWTLVFPAVASTLIAILGSLRRHSVTVSMDIARRKGVTLRESGSSEGT